VIRGKEMVKNGILKGGCCGSCIMTVKKGRKRTKKRRQREHKYPKQTKTPKDIDKNNQYFLHWRVG
jgi:ferredoxin